MPIYQTEDSKLLAWHDENTIKRHRPIISKELIDKFGKEPLSPEQLIESLFFSLKWYTDKMLAILSKENELAFYQTLFMLHEFSCEFHVELPNQSPISALSDKDFSIYRRVLKLCLEQGCDIPMRNGASFTPNYLKSKETVIEDLLYLGDFVYSLSNILAQQHIVEDSVDLYFTDDDLFYFDHKHHYGQMIDLILESTKDHLSEAVIDQTSLNDVKTAFENCLGVNYDQATKTIALIHHNFSPIEGPLGGQLVPDEWAIYPKNLEHLFKIPYEDAERFYKGLTLSRDNKLSISDAVYKPQNINRYLYRPFLIWNVDGKDLTIVGRGIFYESIVSLCTNSFGWGKFPTEWDSPCFRTFIQGKMAVNDKILEDAAEDLLKSNSIIYDRNVTSLKKWNNQGINIENDECGEIDFMFILNETIYVGDSKHHTARYDMNNFKNDYSAFETSKKAYNKTISRKLSFLSSRINDLEEHFQVVLNDRSFKLTKASLEGIFIINTPTFVMYNNPYRIYTLKSFREFVEGTFEDPKFTVIHDEEDETKFTTLTYPYFRKPEYVVFDNDDDE